MIRSIIVIISLFFSQRSFTQKAPKILAQNTIDTLRLIRDNFKYEADILFTIKNDNKVRAWTKYYVFNGFRCLADRKNDSALFYSEKAIKVFDEKEKDFLPSAGLIHKAYYIKGLRAYFESNYITAIKNFNKGLKYIEKYPKCYDGKSWESYIYSFLSDSHYNVGDLKLALFFKKKTLDDYRMGFKYFSLTTYLSLGNLYARLNHIDTAKVYMHKALKTYKYSIRNHTEEASIESMHLNGIGVYNNLGNYHYQENNIDSALYYFRKANRKLTKKIISVR